MPNDTPISELDKNSPEYIEAMVAKAEGRDVKTDPPADAQGEPEAKTEDAPERPAWLPEKFKTPEDMAAAYAELEQKQSTGEKKPEGDEKGTETAEMEKAAEEAVNDAGLDMATLGQKIADKGDLDADDYAALAKVGIGEDMVKSFIAGQKALADQMVGRMHEAVGGQENFDNLLEWARENLTRDEITAFDDTIDRGSESAVKLALEGLNAKFKAAGGDTPNLIGGGKGGTTKGDVFRSTSELTRAMNDPRYATDPAYQADVIAKLERSNIL